MREKQSMAHGKKTKAAQSPTFDFYTTKMNQKIHSSKPNLSLSLL